MNKKALVAIACISMLLLVGCLSGCIDEEEKEEIKDEEDGRYRTAIYESRGHDALPRLYNLYYNYDIEQGYTSELILAEAKEIIEKNSEIILLNYFYDYNNTRKTATISTLVSQRTTNISGKLEKIEFGSQNPVLQINDKIIGLDMTDQKAVEIRENYIGKNITIFYKEYFRSGDVTGLDRYFEGNYVREFISIQEAT